MQNKQYNRPFRHIASTPFILGMIIPLIFLDICIEIYHHVAFPLYGIDTIPRSHYIKIDRHRLSYLNHLDKLWCAYCGYANGLFHYSSTIAATTEHYWCGVKHKPSKDFKEPAHHKHFAKYDDEADLKKKFLS